MGYRFNKGTDAGLEAHVQASHRLPRLSTGRFFIGVVDLDVLMIC